MSARTRMVGAVVVAVTLVAATTVALVERGNRAALEARVERLERDRARQSPPSSPEQPGSENPLAALLDALTKGGGAGGLEDVLGGGAATDCASVLGSAVGGGGGLFGGGPDLFGGGGQPGGAQPSTDPAQQLREVSAMVEQLRELRFKRVPEPKYLPPDQLRQRVLSELDKEVPPEAAAQDGRVLAALGALPRGADLKELTRQALGEQVLGFYEPESGELVVGQAGSPGGLDPAALMALAHELDHALTDQVLELPVHSGRPPPGTEDSALARLALVEGDATLVTQLYGLKGVGLMAQLGTLGDSLAAQQKLAGLPPQIRQSLIFPYLDGLSFACKLHAKGGWKAIDQAYARPPTTTAQVLFPDRYLSGEEAADPKDPGTPGEGWRQEAKQSLGAAQLLWLLSAPGGKTEKALDDPKGRAAAWAGGEMVVWAREGVTAVGISLVERPGGPGLCDTMATWYQAAFPTTAKVGVEAGEKLASDGGDQDATVRCSGPNVRIGIGPDLGVARALAKG